MLTELPQFIVCLFLIHVPYFAEWINGVYTFSVYKITTIHNTCSMHPHTPVRYPRLWITCLFSSFYGMRPNHSAWFPFYTLEFYTLFTLAKIHSVRLYARNSIDIVEWWSAKHHCSVTYRILFIFIMYGMLYIVSINWIIKESKYHY